MKTLAGTLREKRISNAGKYGPVLTPYLGTFHGVEIAEK